QTKRRRYNNGAKNKQETIGLHRAKLNRNDEKRMTKSKSDERRSVNSDHSFIRVSCPFRQSRFVLAHFSHWASLPLSAVHRQVLKWSICNLSLGYDELL